MTRLRALALALALGACGGAPARTEPPEDEVDAAWTAGDDAALPGAEGEAAGETETAP